MNLMELNNAGYDMLLKVLKQIKSYSVECLLKIKADKAGGFADVVLVGLINNDVMFEVDLTELDIGAEKDHEISFILDAQSYSELSVVGRESRMIYFEDNLADEETILVRDENTFCKLYRGVDVQRKLEKFNFLGKLKSNEPIGKRSLDSSFVGKYDQFLKNKVSGEPYLKLFAAEEKGQFSLLGFAYKDAFIAFDPVAMEVNAEGADTEFYSYSVGLTDFDEIDLFLAEISPEHIDSSCSRYVLVTYQLISKDIYFRVIEKIIDIPIKRPSDSKSSRLGSSMMTEV